MSAGKDEASSGFLLDAPNSLNTNFYLLVGANAYGYTNLASSSTATGDVDTYALLLNVGYSYTVISTSQVLYSPGVETMAFVLTRYGALTTLQYPSKTETTITQRSLLQIVFITFRQFRQASGFTAFVLLIIQLQRIMGLERH
jgi:hypothetical protein